MSSCGVCLCVCVCEWVSERERERECMFFYFLFFVWLRLTPSTHHKGKLKSTEGQTKHIKVWIRLSLVSSNPHISSGKAELWTLNDLSILALGAVRNQ